MTQQTGFRLAPLLLAALLCVLLGGCDRLSSGAAFSAHEDNHDFVQHSQPPAVDAKVLQAANEALTRYSDPNVPVMDVPQHPGGGTLEEVRLPGRAEEPGRPGFKGKSKGAATPVAEEPRQPIELQFVDASLKVVVDALFEQYLKKPYSLLPDFRDQKVNWIVSGNYTSTEILHMFETFLEVHGVSLSLRDGVYFVAGAPQRAGSLEDGTFGQTTGVWRLEHVDAKELIPMLRTFTATPDRVMVIDSSNILVITAGTNEIRNIDGFLGRIDVPALENRRVLIYTPRYITPQALVALLDNLPKKLGSALTDAKKSIEAEAVLGQPKVVILTRSEEMKKLALDYIAEVDRAGQDHRQLFYYTAHNQKAEEIRATLDQIIKGMFKDSDPTTPIAIVAHVPSNSLLITASPEEFYQIKKVIDRIDFSVPSLLLDTVVVEVSLNDELANGVEWFLRARLGSQALDFSTFTNPITAGSQTATLGALALHSDAVATINLLSTKTKLQVLSRPRVVVRNKQKAIIKSVQEIRILKTTGNSPVTSGGTSQLLNEYETKEVGITLDVTPTIGDDGTISMQFKIEDSSQGPDINSQPSFDKRQVDTEFIASTGETIFIGGIIKRQNQLNNKAVPVIGELPVLDNLFNSDDAIVGSSELVILVTPYVYSDKYAARILTDAFAGYFKAGR